MEALSVILVVIAGLIFGSFLNVCISRLPPHESIVRPRSRCPRCRAPIALRDNIPLLSFVLLRGQCRACHKPIAWRYPAIELAMAALWLLCWLKFGFTLEALGTAVLSFLLLGLAAMDAETMRLPDTFTLPGIVVGIGYSSVICGRVRCALLSTAWATAGAAIILAISGIYWLMRKHQGMGIGDAKLVALIAAWLGPIQALLVLFLGVLAAAVYGIALSIARRRFDATAPLPLGSFLAAATLFAAFQGQHALTWYSSFFF
jgi:leader peptidase (prepilin peptidase) / N-methyltransferase